MKNRYLIYFILVSLFMGCFTGAFIHNVVNADDNSGGTIIGSAVQWENTYAKLVVYPHTSKNDITQLQYANLTWKLPDNIIDVAFRFDMVLSNANIWKLVGSDWVNINSNFKHEVYNSKHYYYVQNFNVVQYQIYRFKWSYDVKINTNGKWDLLAKLSSDSINMALSTGRYVMLDPWWNSSWSHYLRFTINKDYITYNLANFPVLVTINSTIGARTDNMKSIRFIAVDNLTQYYFEAEVFDSTSTSWFWVNLTSISSSTNTIFYMYYNNSASVTTLFYNKYKVWNNDYIAVYHMTGADYTKITDSTSNKLNVTAQLSIPIYDAISKIYHGVTFDGSNDALTVPSNDKFSPSALTVEAWGNCVSSASGNALTGRLGSSTSNYVWRNYFTGVFPCVFRFMLYDSGSGNYIYRDSTSQNPKGWNYYTSTWNGGTNPTTAIKIYKNASEISDVTGTGGTFVDLNTPTTVTIIGDEYFTGGYTPWKGTIDELRYSKVARNSTWISVSFNTANRTTGFMMCGNQQSIPVVYSGVYITSTFPNIIERNVCPCCISIGCNITDSLGLKMTIRLKSNYSDGVNYKDMVVFKNVYNGSYHAVVFNFSKYGYSYYWYVYVNASDGSTTSSNINKIITTTDYNCSGGSSYTKTESDSLFLGAILTVDNFQFCLLIMLGLWIFLISKVNDDSLFGILQIFIGLPLCVLISGYAYLNALTYGYMLGICIILVSLLVLAFSYWKNPDK